MLARATGLLACAALASLVVAGGGCEAIVNGDVPGYTAPAPTSTGGTNPPPPPPSGLCADGGSCPDGQYCKGAGCVACDPPGHDPCDGYDNDCNGKVDDGPLSDHDNDGYSFCGHVDNGKLVGVDCDDSDSSVHPGATEVCNGKDDDCNGIIDDPGVACPAGKTCVPRTGACIDTTQACTDTSCPPGQICDAQSKQCVTQTAVLGAPCSADKACLSGVCGSQSTLGPYGGTCTKPCCSSKDCDAGFVCYGAGTGGNYCVKADTLQRAPLGTTPPGGTCNVGGDCRSGLCVAHKCADACCSDNDCTGGTTCNLITLVDKMTFGCAPPPGTVEANQACTQDTDCKSGVCMEYPGYFSTPKRCAAPCCGSNACGQPQGLGYNTVCYDEQTTTKPPTVVPICDTPALQQGTKKVGDPCSQGSDCISERCDAATHACTDVCCVDADCGNPSYACRPTQVSSGTYLRCVPK